MTNLTATSELAIAIAHLETALNVVLSNMGQQSVSLSPFYVSHADMVAKLDVNTDLPSYQFDRFVQVAVTHISNNVKLSDRVRGLSAEMTGGYIFFHV
jgi:hypothetical protein